MLNEGVELGFSTFFFIFSLGKSNSNSSGDISNTIGPNEFIEFSVDSNISSTHGLLSDLDNFSNGSRSFLLERDLVTLLVEIDGGVNRFFFFTQKS